MVRIFLIFAFLLGSATAFAADKITELFTLDHQMSQHCEKRIKENLRFEKGVSKIDISLKENTIAITFDPSKTDTEKLIQAFSKIGFNAELLSPDGAAAKPEVCPHDCGAPQQCPPAPASEEAPSSCH